jgi:polynucleotide 5'-kinase involved in rRNA processing
MDEKNYRCKSYTSKKVHFASDPCVKEYFSMPSVNQIVKNEWTASQNGASRRPYIIGVVGGTNSGKTSVCRKIVSEVSKNAVRLEFEESWCLLFCALWWLK